MGEDRRDVKLGVGQSGTDALGGGENINGHGGTEGTSHELGRIELQHI